MSRAEERRSPQMPPVHHWAKAVARAEHLRAPVRQVAVTLALYMNRDGTEGRPGAARLARETGLHVSTVYEALRLLVEDGWLVVTEPGGPPSRPTTYAARRPSPRLALVYPQACASGESSPPASPRPEARRVLAQDERTYPETSPLGEPDPEPVDECEARRQLDAARRALGLHRGEAPTADT